MSEAEQSQPIPIVPGEDDAHPPDRDCRCTVCGPYFADKPIAASDGGDYAHASARAAAPVTGAVPEGWKQTVGYPTDEMLAAGANTPSKPGTVVAYEVWRAMLAASPAAPAQPAETVTNAARDVLAERQRQIKAEGWTPEHDDEHKEGEMCYAAAGYACAASDVLQAIDHQFDGDGQPTFNEPASLPHRAPWPHGWAFKRAPVRRQLVKAGALILAEIERIDRLLVRGPICSDCGARKGAAHNYGCMYSDLDV